MEMKLLGITILDIVNSINEIIRKEFTGEFKSDKELQMKVRDRILDYFRQFEAFDIKKDIRIQVRKSLVNSMIFNYYFKISKGNRVIEIVPTLPCAVTKIADNRYVIAETPIKENNLVIQGYERAGYNMYSLIVDLEKTIGYNLDNAEAVENILDNYS